jgi:hypothetical protein
MTFRLPAELDRGADVVGAPIDADNAEDVVDCDGSMRGHGSPSGSASNALHFRRGRSNHAAAHVIIEAHPDGNKRHFCGALADAYA